MATAFELTKDVARQESEAERKAMQDALARRAASQGFGEGSGLLEKQQRLQDVERRKALAGRLGGIDIAQAEEDARLAEAERQRAFQAGEAEKGRLFTAGEAEKGRTFTTAERMGTQEFTAQESLRARELQKEIADKDLNLREQQLAQQATQFASEMDFKRYSLEFGADEAEAEADRAWKAAQAVEERVFAQSEAEKTRAFQAQEASYNRELEVETRNMNLTMQEKQLAENARQFDSRQEFELEYQARGFTQAEIERAWQASENATNRAYQTTERIDTQAFQYEQANFDRELQRETTRLNLSMQEQQLAETARQFDSNQTFQAEMQRRGFDEASIARAWEASENAENRAFTATEREATQQFTMQQLDAQTQSSEYLARLADDLQRGTLSFQSTLQQDSELRMSQARAAFNLGQTGGTLSAAQQANPALVAAFQDGQTGKAATDMERNQQAIIDQRNALIAGLDTEDDNYRKDLNDIFLAAQNGTMNSLPGSGTLPGGGTTGGTGFEGVSTTPPVNEAKNFSTGGYSYTGAGDNRERFSETPPASGEDIQIGGTKYTVSGGIQTYSPFFGDDTDYFFVKSKTDGKTYLVVPDSYGSPNHLADELGATLVPSGGGSGGGAPTLPVGWDRMIRDIGRLTISPTSFSIGTLPGGTVSPTPVGTIRGYPTITGGTRRVF